MSEEKVIFDERTKKKLLKFQKNEINEHHIYKKLAKKEKGHNKEVLQKISDEELEHYKIFKTYTNTEVKPSRLTVWKYGIIVLIFGLIFGIKLMEKGEGNAQDSYLDVAGSIPNMESIISIPEIEAIVRDEEEHERELIALIDEERLKYVSSIVLGLNDALVELTGALAGFTLTFQDARIIAVAGLVTGIAAALSMAASEYLSTRTEESGEKSPFKASLYTGIAYILVVTCLIVPYFLIPDIYIILH